MVETDVIRNIKLSKIKIFIYFLLLGILIFSVRVAVEIGSWLFVVLILSVVFIIAMLFKEYTKQKLLKSM